MKITNSKSFSSKIAPGVTFVLRKLNKAKRDKLEDLQAPAQEKLRPLREEFAPLNREMVEARKSAQYLSGVSIVERDRAALVSEGVSKEEAEGRLSLPDLPVSPETKSQWQDLFTRISTITFNELNVIAMRFLFVRVEGLEIEDDEGNTVPSTFDNLLAYGEDDLNGELAILVARETGLLPEETENLSSPSTSAAAVDGKRDSADPAGTPETITPSAA